MHICCANCAIQPVGHFRAKGVELSGFWFNHNIHPMDEYEKRLDSVRRMQDMLNMDVEYAGEYGMDDFMKLLNDNPGRIRCEACYGHRLEQTARVAKEAGHDAFTSSLLISPYQKHDLVVKSGLNAQEKFDVEFLYEDLRPLWQEGRAVAKEAGFYKQYYCGCFMSKQERDMERSAKKTMKAGAAA